jgi:predicted DCC family thiol-disulfide oxidoreductase YuxK
MPYQDAPSPPMTQELREACALSSHVITTDGKILNGGRGSIFILRKLGWTWMWILSVPPLIWPVEVGYGIFARNRPFFFRFFSRFISRLESFEQGDE